jgi:hypothetical protein
VGDSGSGKDIGGLTVRLVSAYSNYVGSSGSASGLCDAYMASGAGLLSVSEFEPYLDPRAWQSMARTMLTNAFNEGHFDIRLSGRSGKRRVSRYCYPSIVANIQPRVLRRYAGSIHMDSGFLPRFLISALPCRRWRPSSGCFDMRPAIEALAVYDRLAGDVTPEANYLADMDAMFAEHEAIPGVFRRYINEYGPRIACILQADGRAIRPETWDKTRSIVQWYYAQAESVLDLVRDDAAFGLDAWVHPPQDPLRRSDQDDDLAEQGRGDDGTQAGPTPGGAHGTRLGRAWRGRPLRRDRGGAGMNVPGSRVARRLAEMRPNTDALRHRVVQCRRWVSNMDEMNDWLGGQPQ